MFQTDWASGLRDIHYNETMEGQMNEFRLTWNHIAHWFSFLSIFILEHDMLGWIS